MRTKTLLLTAAALLAAGMVSSQATPVYSQNIVGYATVSANGSGGTYYMTTCPFVIGVSNGADEVYGLNANPSALPPGTTILIFNAAETNIYKYNSGGNVGPGAYVDVPAQGYTTYYYDPQYVGSGFGAWWDDGNYDDNVPTPTLPPGQAYFLLPTANTTNTFAGTVAVPVGGTNTMALNGSGGTYYMVSSVVPYAGDVTNSPGVNLNNLPAGSTILAWNAAATTIQTFNSGGNINAGFLVSVPGQSYSTYYYDPQYVGSGFGAWWDDGNYDDNVPDPTLSVGGACFVLPAANYNWVQIVPSN